MSARVVKKDISAENQFTESIRIDPVYAGRLNVSVSGDNWTAVVTLQRHFFDELAGVWHDVDIFTSKAETSFVDLEQGNEYRIGVKTGDYTSGPIPVRISR